MSLIRALIRAFNDLWSMSRPSLRVTHSHLFPCLQVTSFSFFPIYAGVGCSSFCSHWTRISLFFYNLSLGDCLPNNQSIVVCPFTTFQQSSTLMDLSFSQLFIEWFPWHTPHFDWKVVKASLLDLLSSLLILPLAASPLAYSEDFTWYSDSSVIQSLRSLSHSRGLCSFTHL